MAEAPNVQRPPTKRAPIEQESPRQQSDPSGASSFALNGTITETAGVRGSPGENLPVVDKVERGTSVYVVGRTPDNTWLEVEYDGRRGWIRARHLTFTGDLGVVPVTESPSPDEQQAPASSTPSDTVLLPEAVALNDRPRGADRLNFEDYANAFARMLTNLATRPPLTFGIYGAWGMGKSFLMSTIRKALESQAAQARERDPAKAPNFIFVEFNAWVYSGSDNLWAGLISRIYRQIEKSIGRDRVATFRLSKRERKRLRLLPLRVILSAVPAAVLIVIANWDQLSSLWSGVFGVTSAIALIVGLVTAFKSTFDLVSKAFTERAEQFNRAVAQPNFRDKIGFMADIKDEIDFVIELLQQQNANNRVVIFIDDLDRCPPPKAVEVLEAIMLLLSDDDSPFYVFLGLDARVLVKAIEERYGKVLVEAGVSGYEYLDKIVQIPFTIPAADKETIQKYLHGLVPGEGPQPAQPAAGPLPTRDGAPQASPNRDAAGSDTPQPRAEVAFTDDETQALDDFAEYISRNPRRAKRIVNIYRLVRMLDKDSLAGLARDRSRQLIKWVILTEQWPYRMGLVVEQRQNAEQTASGVGSKGSEALSELYAAVAAKLASDEGKHLLRLDEDPELFDNFINREPTPISAADVRAFEPLSFNLNPAIGGEIRSMLARAAIIAPASTANAAGTPKPGQQPAPAEAAQQA